MEQLFDKSIFEVKDSFEEEDFDYKQFIVSPDDINRDIERFHNGEITKGFGTGISELDDYVVAKENEFFAVVGKKGDGKTTILQVKFLLWSIANGLIWVVAFKENVDWAVKMSLLNLLLGEDEKQLKYKNPELYSKASDWIDKHFIFIAIDTMREGTQVCKGLIADGVKVHALVLDPANSFESGWYDSGNEFSDGKKTAIKLLKFTLNTCSLYISQHPTMSGQRKEGDITSKEAEGGWFFNKASFTINYNRDRGTNTTRVAVENVRNKFTGGDTTHPDSPILIHWGRYKIDIECQGNVRIDVIQELRIMYNPMNESKQPIRQIETIPNGTIEDAFEEAVVTNDVPF